MILWGMKGNKVIPCLDDISIVVNGKNQAMSKKD